MACLHCWRSVRLTMLVQWPGCASTDTPWLTPGVIGCACFVHAPCFAHALRACFVCQTCILRLKMLSLNVWTQLRSVLKRCLYCSKVFTSLHGCAAFLPQLPYVSFSSTVDVFSLIVLVGSPQSCWSKLHFQFPPRSLSVLVKVSS